MITNHSPGTSSSPPTRRALLFSGFLFLGVAGMGLGLFFLQRQQAEQLRLLDISRKALDAEAAQRVERAHQGMQALQKSQLPNSSAPTNPPKN